VKAREGLVASRERGFPVHPDGETTSNWLHDRSNQLLLGVLGLASLLRLLYFNVNKAEWWDSTLYLLEAKRLALGIAYAPVYEAHRAPMLPLLGALAYRAGLGEVAILFGILLFSVAAVYLTYRVATILYDRTVGILAAFFMAVFWENLFFTQRILTEVPALFFWLLTVYCYVRGVVRDERSLLYGLVPSFVLMFLTQFRTGVLVLPLALHVLAARKWRVLRTREFARSLALGLLLFFPYVVFSYRTYRVPLGFLKAYQLGNLRTGRIDASAVFLRYLEYFPRYLGILLLGLLLYGGVTALVSLLREADAGARKERLQRAVLIAGLTLFPILAPSFIERFVHRYAICAFPAVFLVIASAAAGITRRLKTQSRLVAGMFLAGVVVIGAMQQILTADQLIRTESTSYLPVKEAGLWIKEHSREDDVVVSNSWPQITFYAERRTVSFPGTEEEFEAVLRRSRPRFLMVSSFEPHPSWVYPYLEKRPSGLEQAVRMGTAREAEAIVYEYMALAKP
jgi:4-amino-4-deoxy-L-arabinose transferase-like glycosyltransferase